MKVLYVIYRKQYLCTVCMYCTLCVVQMLFFNNFFKIVTYIMKIVLYIAYCETN